MNEYLVAWFFFAKWCIYATVGELALRRNLAGDNSGILNGRVPADAMANASRSRLYKSGIGHSTKSGAPEPEAF